MVPKMLLQTRNISRAEEGENLMTNLSLTLQNLKKLDTACNKCDDVSPKVCICIFLNLLLNFCCFTA